MRISPATRLYISVSNRPGNFGATVYNSLFAKRGIDAIYLPRTAPSAPELCSALRSLDVAGCSVSTPLKSEVIPHLDRLLDCALPTQSVNTIVNNSGALLGYNTDVDGILAALEGQSFKTVRIYGSGSVVQSLIYALKRVGTDEISICARSKTACERIAKQHALRIDDLSPVDLLVNATPASLDPSQEALFKQISDSRIVFDLMVSAKNTPLIDAAIASKKVAIPGLSMAKGQIQKQFELYTGIKVSLAEIDEIVSHSF